MSGTYPWTGRFSSREEVEKYFAGDRLVCLLCGHSFRQLPPHIRRKHDVTASEYKTRFALPHTRGLTSSETRSKKSESAKQQFVDTPPKVWAPPGNKEAFGRRAVPAWVAEELGIDAPFSPRRVMEWSDICCEEPSLKVVA